MTILNSATNVSFVKWMIFEILETTFSLGAFVVLATYIS